VFTIWFLWYWKICSNNYFWISLRNRMSLAVIAKLWLTEFG